MPKIVDHELRREEVLGALWRVVRRDGLDSATIRTIAAEAGCSPGVLAHYFRDKDDILRSALELANRRMSERVGLAMQDRAGLDALAAVLSQSLPLDEERTLCLHLEVSMWGRGLTDPEGRAVHLGYYDLWSGLVAGLVRDAAEANEVAAATDIDAVTAGLVAFVDGLAVDALLHPERLPPERQLHLLQVQLDLLRAAPAAR